jgi:hypothetical protein
MACALQASDGTIDPALVTIWRKIAADAASPKTLLSAVVKESLKVTRFDIPAPHMLQLTSRRRRRVQTIAQALRLYTPQEIYISLNGGKDSRWRPCFISK